MDQPPEEEEEDDEEEEEEEEKEMDEEEEQEEEEDDGRQAGQDPGPSRPPEKRANKGDRLPRGGTSLSRLSDSSSSGSGPYALVSACASIDSCLRSIGKGHQLQAHEYSELRVQPVSR